MLTHVNVIAPVYWISLVSVVHVWPLLVHSVLHTIYLLLKCAIWMLAMQPSSYEAAMVWCHTDYSSYIQSRHGFFKTLYIALTGKQTKCCLEQHIWVRNGSWQRSLKEEHLFRLALRTSIHYSVSLYRPEVPYYLANKSMPLYSEFYQTAVIPRGIRACRCKWG